MSATAETTALHSNPDDHVSTGAEMLALVQGDMVISTFPEDQMDAAIDLARVLCRALTQPVDLFRVRCCEVGSVGAGERAHTAGPGWTRVAHLHYRFRVGVDLVMCDPERPEAPVVRPLSS